MENFIRLTTPIGPIVINKAKVCAVAFNDDSGVNTSVYLEGDPEPFNIIEDFETVCDLLGC